MNWKIEVCFIGDYANEFDKNEQVEREDSEYRFQLAIEQIIKETGIIPMPTDWIDPLAKADYSLDCGLVKDRSFDPVKRVIQFSIE